MQPRDLSAHDPYHAGRGVEEVAREQGRSPEAFITLSSNENPLGPAPAAVDAIREAAPTVNRYPKTVHVDLVDRIAEEWGVDTDQVWLAAGADGALDYLARATLEPGDAVLVPEPGFAYYAKSARFHHGTVDTYHLDQTAGFPYTPDTVLDAYHGHRIVYLTTPHNPTGATMDRDAVATVATETDPETLVVVDEAYAEYADTPSAVPLVEDRDDVAVLRTFSKAYGLAGLRVGYALVPAPWARAYPRVNTPFAASELACRAGLAALEDDDHVERSVDLATWARDHIRSSVAAPTYASDGNFVLVDVSGTPHGDHDTAAAAVTAALEADGVIVRDCTSFGLPGCIRMTCGTEPETRTAVQTLNEVLAG